MLAATFVTTGVDAFLHPMARAKTARPLVHSLPPAAHLPKDPELVVRGAGVVMALGGSLLAVGRLPRLSALALAVGSAPATYLDHPFWLEEDPEHRRAQRRQFLKNVGLIGGVLLASVDTEGHPGLAWRSRHAVQDATRTTRRAARDARRTTARTTGRAARRVRKVVPVQT